jgi:hypothetical protein
MLGNNAPAPLGRILDQCAIPLIIVSSGTMGNNGALSGVAAVTAVHPAAYVYLPANAISAGSAAGLYYAVFSSTTAATVYNNVLSGSPGIPASPTAFATTGPGAFTQSTSEITLTTINVPANSMGTKGRLEIDADFTYPTSANVKTLKGKFGGSTLWSSTPTNTTSTKLTKLVITNRGAFNSQRHSENHYTSSGAVGAGNGTASIDTSASADITLTVQLSVATETIALESFQVILYPKG